MTDTADLKTLEERALPGAADELPTPTHDRLEWTTAVFWVALAFSTFQVITAAFSPLSSQVVRSVHVGFVLLMVFLVHPGFTKGGAGAGMKALGWVLGLAGFATGLYQWVFEADLTQRAGDLTRADWVVGIVLLVLVFEAARRTMGIALPLICAIFLAYGLWGNHLPGPLMHRGYGADQIVGTLSFGTEGIYGTPTYVSSSYIFLFILFGAFLEQAGMIRLFNDFAMGTVGHTRGGPAKVAVVTSGLMGTINGSGVANVVTTGQFTIPLMKRFGYSSAFAGGVEATSSMGGQIMPPVMGAVAFIMAETINVPYIEVCKAALIPAILYFVTAFWMVHLEAGHKHLLGLPKDECPNPWAAIRRQWFLLIPLIGLVGLLFSGYTPLFSGTVGLALTAILIFAAACMQGIRGTALRVVFWVLLALATAGFFKLGVGAFFVVIALLVALTFVLRTGQDARRLAVQALVDGARHALPVAIACALVGVIIGVINLTGVAAELGGQIIALGQKSLMLALVLTMVTCLVLGMGIPTIPNYIITSSLAAPILLELGVPLIVSHMFVFYFGIMADLTPPVALAAFAAAPIARETGLKISINAIRVAIAGFIMPYMAVYSPALMLQGDSWGATAYVVLKALVAIGLWGGAAIGFLFSPLNWLERIVAIAAACFLVAALPATDEIGFAASAAFVAWHLWRTRRLAGTATAGSARGMSVSVLGVCLALAASMPQGADPMVPPARAGAPHVVFVPQTAFTLAWTHSIEKTRWEEDYRVHAGSGGAPVLTLEKARIRGTGAGMEPPANAVLRHGWYEYAPANQPQGPMRLTRSRYTPDYSWCAQGRCRSLGELLPSDGGITLLWPCHGPKRRR